MRVASLHLTEDFRLGRHEPLAGALRARKVRWCGGAAVLRVRVAFEVRVAFGFGFEFQFAFAFAFQFA